MVEISTLPGFENFKGYYITSCGKVYSTKRKKPGYFMKGKYDSNGYPTVQLYDGHGHYKNIRVHKLVALAYIQNPNNYDTIDHIDGIKTHNYVNNLQWMSRGDNVRKYFNTMN